MDVLSGKKYDLQMAKSLRSYLWRIVYSKSGERFGRVWNVLFGESELYGIIVWYRFKRIFVGKEYFSIDSKGSLMLDIDPLQLLFRKKVYDADGVYLGKVYDFARKGSENLFSHIIVKKHMYSRAIQISSKDIKVSKKNILLDKIYYENK